MGASRVYINYYSGDSTTLLNTARIGRTPSVKPNTLIVDRINIYYVPSYPSV